MNPEYPRVYAPVLRGPLLFNHNTGLSGFNYNTARPRFSQSSTNICFPHPNTPYRPQSQYTFQAPLLNNFQSYRHYPDMPQVMGPPLVPISSYSNPNVTYASTVSSKGLSLILIATLILVALDLVIVRPQKSRFVLEVHSDCPSPCNHEKGPEVLF